ncbi:glycosyltransferase family 4 protein [Alcanivorax quisquiliarum]|uniref:Glycosyltransferase family 4 protein n=1 Tax=Alcanivorax quisquiliarum TaxID=2933565 RepID=A0ABT0EA74_9GAMM|nr:glycosyltransferase family 4 protein [Alcanivorax quisquiliarum]MCK0538747.1 glycosyltransferase family 4 protein [Alcanivorax quisquiliarum]
MKLAFCLYRYFPYGGLQRDFWRIARASLARGHQVTCYVAAWEGEALPGLKVEQLPVQGSSNHGRMASFAAALGAALARQPADIVLGFNRLPGLDVYFASDSCFAAHLAEKPLLLRWLPRYRTYLRLEQQVAEHAYFLFLNEHQQHQYQQHYALSAKRFTVLPPGIEPVHRQPDNAHQLRATMRNTLSLSDGDKLLLFVGSGFRVKGLDRALDALASLPDQQLARTRLMIVGNDDPKPFLASLSPAVRQRIAAHVRSVGPRDDVPALMQAADLLLHPAYRESAGMVLLEATVAGLPVLTTDTCGYARYVLEAQSGEVIRSPFSQEVLNVTLAKMLDSLPGPWGEAGARYGREHDLYSLPERVVDLLEARFS